MGGFQRFIVGGEGGVEVGGADVELFREVSGVGFAGVERHAEEHEEEESDEAADGDFDDERHRGGFFSGGGAGFLGDLVEILEIVHKLIIS